MAWRDAVTHLGRLSAPFIGILLLVGIVGALIVFVPARAAATLLGMLSAAMLSYSLMFRSRHTVQIAVLWASIAITADAAYARLNDQASVTLANALTKIVGFQAPPDTHFRGGYLRGHSRHDRRGIVSNSSLVMFRSSSR